MEFCGGVESLLLLLLTLLVKFTSTAKPGVMADYCEETVFKADCAEDEVIMMEAAQYGRMELGACLSTEYGAIGCYSDVMTVMDKWCSGQRKCEVAVRDLFVQAQAPCPAELRGYLRANYTCQRVAMQHGECCRDTDMITLRDGSGFLASSVTERTNCGSIDCPWSIEVAKGQKISITLFDFGVPTSLSTDDSRATVCHVYAIIKENLATQTVCAGQQRVKNVHITTYSSVQIRVVTKKRPDKDLSFMIKYEAIGCPDLENPPNGFVERQGNRASVSCYGDPSEKWQIVCEDSKWIGKVENCTAAVGSVRGGLGDFFTLTPDLSIVIIIIVAMIIAIVILMVGVFCLRRRWLQSNQQQRHQKRPLPNPHEDPRGEGSYIMRDNKSSLADNTYPREHNYFRTWELQRHPARPVMPNEPVDNQDYSRRYVDHIYESPTFSRRDLGLHEDGTQYFELDPDADPFYPGAPGQGVSMRSAPNPATAFLNSKQRCSYPESTVVDHKMSNVGSFTS